MSLACSAVRWENIPASQNAIRRRRRPCNSVRKYDLSPCGSILIHSYVQFSSTRPIISVRTTNFSLPAGVDLCHT
jgi:hypothetical protein